MNAADRVFVATVTRHRDDPRLMIVEVDWPRLTVAVDDRLDAVEIAERLIGNHFCIDPNAIQVDVRHVLDGG